MLIKKSYPDRVYFKLLLINYVFRSILNARHWQVRSNRPAQPGLQMVGNFYARLAIKMLPFGRLHLDVPNVSSIIILYL